MDLQVDPIDPAGRLNGFARKALEQRLLAEEVLRKPSNLHERRWAILSRTHHQPSAKSRPGQASSGGSMTVVRGRKLRSSGRRPK